MTRLVLPLICLSFLVQVQLEGQASPPKCSTPPKVIRDLMWVWGNPGMAEEGPHTAASFAQAGPAERARLLGVPNIIMAGKGLPRDDQKAEDLKKK